MLRKSGLLPMILLSWLEIRSILLRKGPRLQSKEGIKGLPRFKGTEI
jgi:hypothetical protein